MNLTHDQDERDAVTAWRMIFEIFGVLLSVVIQGIMITVYGSKYSCEYLKQSFNQSTITNQTIFSNTSHTKVESEYSKLGEGYLVSAGIMCTILIICISATFFGTKEIKGILISF